jgi:hypothetical protein
MDADKTPQLVNIDFPTHISADHSRSERQSYFSYLSFVLQLLARLVRGTRSL